jgi:hypothetical protein
MRKNFVLLMVVAISLNALFAGQAYAQDKRSRFDITVDSLIVQIDIQIQDRGKVVKILNDLYESLKDSETTNLDWRIESARRSAIQREALLTADRMSLDPNGKARVSELVGFLDRVVTRDQQLFDQYLSSKEALRFEYERQLAKIKGEQTVLKNIRRDMERLKKFPSDKEQARFYLESVRGLLDGLGKSHK